MKLLQDVFETYHDLLKIAPFSISKLIPFESAFGNQCFLAYNASTLTMANPENDPRATIQFKVGAQITPGQQNRVRVGSIRHQ